jgi:hypothetical protein
VRTTSRLNIFAGIWLVLSPFILAYGAEDAPWNPIAVGVLVAVLAYLRLNAQYSPWLSWVAAALGVWLFTSGFWLADSMRAEWNSWVLGALIVLFSTGSASARPPAPPPPR